MKNYYRTLGVLDDAEDIVIRAAYKALAQRYHPDKWGGSSNEANKRMAEINEAYAILSDPIKRNEYDACFFKDTERNDAENVRDEGLDDIPNEEVEGWAIATEFFPIIKEQYDQLHQISGILANTFRAKLLESKDFKNSDAIRIKYEKDYLIRFYGSDANIREFAKSLLLNNFPNAAIKVNKIVRFMGDAVDLSSIKKKIYQEFPDVADLFLRRIKDEKFIELLNKANSGILDVSDAKIIIERIYGTYVIDRWGLYGFYVSYTFTVKGTEVKLKSAESLLDYAKNLAKEHT